MVRKSLGRALGLVVALGAFLSLASSPVLAQSPAAQRGLTFVRVHCAQCHAIDKVSDSPLTIAPPFRTLHLKFPLESLRRRLAEGIVVDHPTMPQFRPPPPPSRSRVCQRCLCRRRIRASWRFLPGNVSWTWCPVRCPRAARTAPVESPSSSPCRCRFFRPGRAAAHRGGRQE